MKLKGLLLGVVVVLFLLSYLFYHYGLASHERRALFVLPSRFNDRAYTPLLAAFNRSDFVVDVASVERGVQTSGDNMKVPVNFALSEVDASKYDVVVLFGSGRYMEIASNPALLRLVRNAFDSNRILVALDSSALTLGEAGLLEGRRVVFVDTYTPSYLRNKGANFTVIESNVVEDGNIITVGPGAYPVDEVLDLVLQKLSEGG